MVANEQRVRRNPTRTLRGPGRLVLLIAAGAIGLAACSGPSTPHVASLGTSSGNGGGSPTSAPVTGDPTPGSTPASSPPTGDATKLLDEWTACIHSHGDPNQTVPAIDQYDDINLHIPEDAQDLSGPIHGLTAPCSNYLTAASTALRNGQPMPSPPDHATDVRFSQCMRANGVPNYPDPEPTGDETNFNGTGVDPNSPQVQSVNDLCSKQLGIPSNDTPPAGVIGVTSGPNGGPPGAPGGNGGGGANPVPASG